MPGKIKGEPSDEIRKRRCTIRRGISQSYTFPVHTHDRAVHWGDHKVHAATASVAKILCNIVVGGPVEFPRGKAQLLCSGLSLVDCKIVGVALGA